MPEANGGRRPGRSALVALLAAGTFAAATLAGCGGPDSAASYRGTDADGLHGAVLVEQYDAPATTLTDTSGAPFSLRDDTDKPLTLVFFGYTHCPDICPLTMANVASAMARLDDDQREQVDVVVVTTDPARDDEATMRAWLDRFDPRFVGLTGDLDTIRTIADQLGVFIEKGKKMPSGGYEVDHGTPLLAIGANDRSPVVWTQGFGPADLAEDVALMLAHPDDYGQGSP